MPVVIHRLRPRNGLDERPVETDRGYELVDRRIPDRRHHVENSTFVRSIEEAGTWLSRAMRSERAHRA